MGKQLGEGLVSIRGLAGALVFYFISIWHWLLVHRRLYIGAAVSSIFIVRPTTHEFISYMLHVSAGLVQ